MSYIDKSFKERVKKQAEKWEADYIEKEKVDTPSENIYYLRLIIAKSHELIRHYEDEEE